MTETQRRGAGSSSDAQRGDGTIEPRCPLCGGGPAGETFPYGTRWNGKTFRYLACSECSTAFIDPLPDEADFRRMYAYDAYHTEFYAEIDEESHSFLKRFRASLAGARDLLDFGCGNGSFLLAAANAGFRAEGVELDPGARAAAAKASACRVETLDVLVGEDRRYDVIHLGDVLEHLPNPAVKLRELEKLLRPGGRFFIEGPLEANTSLVYASSRAFGAVRRMIGRPYGEFPPFHLLRTSARAQRDFFTAKMGYETLRFEVEETGWPYFLGRDQLLRPRGVASAVKGAIGALALGAGRLGRLVRLPVGNRFGAIVRPKQ